MKSTTPDAKTVLVTGGAGYIGSHACKALAASGYTPVTFDNLRYGHRRAVRWGPLEVGDLADSSRLEQVISRYAPVAVMHFAAYAYVGESVVDPAKYYRNNVVGTLNLLEAMRANQVDKLVFSSTCATYGDPQAEQISEDHRQQPINPYGASKLMIERILSDFANAYGLRSISLRYFNAAGADPDGELGECHDPETHLIPLVLAAAINTDAEVTIFGDDYATPDGSCIRDYLHVSDIAAAHLLALHTMQSSTDATAKAFNLGNGRGYSVHQVIDAARRITGRAISVKRGPRRAGDPDRLIADAARAQRELGWQPHHSELDDMIASAWHWLQAEIASPPQQHADS